jgi:TatD DNase family protein
MLIDSHCHLEYEGLAEDQAFVLERARAAGIGGFVNISTRQSEWASVVGIGETGLDYYYDRSERQVQQALFRTHIGVARKTGLPLVIHTRDAEEDTIAILEEEMGKGAFPALIHCFTASAGFGRKVLELGLTISLSGIVTFKNAKELQEFAPVIPADRLLVETDSPFLAPVPHRGRTCEPAYVADTARFVAGLRGETLEELAENTTRNFRGLFKKAQV